MACVCGLLNRSPPPLHILLIPSYQLVLSFSWFLGSGRAQLTQYHIFKHNSPFLAFSSGLLCIPYVHAVGLSYKHYAPFTFSRPYRLLAESSH